MKIDTACHRTVLKSEPCEPDFLNFNMAGREDRQEKAEGSEVVGLVSDGSGLSPDPAAVVPLGFKAGGLCRVVLLSQASLSEYRTDRVSQRRLSHSSTRLNGDSGTIAPQGD
ncbi:MAG: hypothetical protein ACK4WH_03400 [Phycisphaerales bacterium]